MSATTLHQIPRYLTTLPRKHFPVSNLPSSSSKISLSSELDKVFSFSLPPLPSPQGFRAESRCPWFQADKPMPVLSHHGWETSLSDSAEVLVGSLWVLDLPQESAWQSGRTSTILNPAAAFHWASDRNQSEQGSGLRLCLAEELNTLLSVRTGNHGNTFLFLFLTLCW